MRSWWLKYQLQKLSGENRFKFFNLHKTEFPQKLYFYSPRLKRRPFFTGNSSLLKEWKESSILERICPTNAISLTPDEVKIDELGCITCGLCVEVAPPGLLEMPAELKL